MKPTRGIVAAALMAAFVGWGGESASHGAPSLSSLTLPTIELLPPEEPPPPETEAFPFLEGEPPGSVSVGNTSHGRLAGAAVLRESEALGILPEQRGRGLAYGTDELVAALEHAAQVLHRTSGTRLWVGNLSAPSGGDIDFSVSHNSGRDADIAFCYQNAAGEPVDPSDLVPLSPDGRSVSGLRFDVARSWTVVRALLTNPRAQVQYLFVAYGLETLMLEHAQAQREPAELLTRAAAIMWQPHGAAPHHDHLHLRLYCGPRDVAGGCVNTGTVHAGVRLHLEARERALLGARAQLGHREPDARRRAIERLALLDDRDRGREIAAYLDDPAVEVRRAAAWALARLGGQEQIGALTALFARERDPLVRIAVVQAIGALGGPEAGSFLALAVGEPLREAGVLLSLLDSAAALRGPALVPVALDAGAALSRDWLEALQPGGDALDDYVVQLAAIEAAARSERLEPVPALLSLLDDRDGALREAAARSLSMITNVGYGLSWSEEGEALDQGRARWRTIYSRARGAVRDGWLLMGFSMSGYRVPRIDPAHGWELVRAIAGRDHLSYNAQRTLARLFRGAATTSWSKAEACRYWLGFIDGRREGYGLDEPPDRTRGACYSL